MQWNPPRACMAANCLGLTEVGVLEPGRYADFLVMKEDPRRNVRALRSIESVWIGGQRVD